MVTTPEMDAPQELEMADPSPATFDDVDRILSEHPLELEKLIPVEEVQLSMPLGADRPVVKVSVRPGRAEDVPDSVELELNSRRVRVELDVEEDFQDYRLL